ncbi:MAG: response regulator, partial [Rhodocyclaceae bacterium]|nr:response regulator [Rhodocyclaceae bacterium]
HSVREVAAVEAGAKSLTLDLSIDAALPNHVVGDALRLEQVLLNLASNAVKFTSQGRVAISVRQLGLEDDAVRVGFEVEDTGIGMTGEQIARLFRPFEQADASTTRKFGGTGLGLSISARLVEFMGGTLSASSVEGEGSRFGFELCMPVAPGGAAAVSVAASPPDARTLSGRRILIVEDNPLNQLVVRELLEGWGVCWRLAENGLQALDMLEDVELVLMDIQMPVMDGIEATRRIRAMPAYASLPIVAVTAHALPEEHQRCMDAGMCEVVTKPVDADRLAAVLSRILEGRPGRGAGDAPLPERCPAPPAGDGRAVLDYATGLHFCGKKPAFYLRMLGRFRENGERQLAELQSLSESSAPGEDFVRSAHTLKGMAATVGALPLRAAALALETRLREGGGGDVRPLVAAVVSAFAEVLEAIDALEQNPVRLEGVQPAAPVL